MTRYVMVGVAAVVLAQAGLAQAQVDVTKLASPTDLNDITGWSTGALPPSTDTMLFDSTSVPTAPSTPFGNSASFYGGNMRVTDIADDLVFNGNNFYIGSTANPYPTLDFSAATADIYFTGAQLRTNGPSSGAGYTINVAPGRSVVINTQTFSRNAYVMPINGGGSVLINGSTNGGGVNRVAYDVTGTGTTIGGNGSWIPSNTNGGYGVRLGSGTFVAPGSFGVGTTTFSGVNSGQSILTMLAGSGFNFELGTGGSFATPSADSDMLNFTAMAANDVVFNSNNIDFLGTGSAGVFKLFDTDLDATTWSGLTLSGQEITAGLTYSNLGSGLTGTLVIGDGTTGDSGDIYLQVVPEPAMVTGAAAAIGAAAIMIRRRRTAAS